MKGLDGLTFSGESRLACTRNMAPPRHEAFSLSKNIQRKETHAPPDTGSLVLSMVKKRRKAKRRVPRVQADRICSSGLATLLSGRPTLKCTMGDAVKRHAHMAPCT